jgi:anaerobic selenocysteine-containing dehydrogenase
VAYYDVTTDGKSCSNATRGLTGLNVRSPFVPPIYNTRQSEDIVFELAERMGMLPGVNGMLSGMLRLGDTYKLKPMQRYKWRDVVNRMLIAKYGQEHDLDSFKQTGFLIESKPLKQTYNYFYFPGSATRIPIYSEHLWAAGETLKANLASVNVEVPGWEGKMDEYFDFYKPVPHWIVSHLLKASPEYDLFVINWKIPFLLFGLGGTIDNPWAQEIIRGFDPYTHVFCVHPDTAAEKGIEEGDTIEATSQHGGKVSGNVHLTELVHPKVIGVAGNFGRVSVGLNPIAQGGLNYNQLLGTSEDTIDPVIGALDNSARVKIERI